MSLHKRLAFQRSMLEHRSLRVPGVTTSASKRTTAASASKATKAAVSSSSASKAKTGRVETPLDLELDLKAQQTKLTLLQDEIDRLKEIKATMEQAKAKGIKEMPAWLQEHENFQQMLLKV